jgi:hypothetical protein
MWTIWRGILFRGYCARPAGSVGVTVWWRAPVPRGPAVAVQKSHLRVNDQIRAVRRFTRRVARWLDVRFTAGERRV